MAEGGQNSPRCRKLSTAGWYYAPCGFDAGSSLGPLRKGRGSALAHQASSGEQAGRPRPGSRAPSCRSVTPAALARVARGSTRHCVSARLPPRGGGAGGRERGREGGRPSPPVPGWKLARLGDWRQRQEPQPEPELAWSSSLCLGLSPAHRCTFLASRSAWSRVPASGCLLLSQNYIWESLTWDFFSFPHRTHTPLWSMPLPRWSPCYPRVPYSLPCYSVSTSPAQGHIPTLKALTLNSVFSFRWAR